MSTDILRRFALTLLACSISAPAGAWDCEFPPPPEASSCPGPQIVDGVGDAIGGGVPSVSDRDHLDIVSTAFTAYGGEHLQIALTVEDLSLPPPPVEFPGSNWSVYFTYGGVRYIVQANGAGSPETVIYTAGLLTGNENGNDVLPINDPINDRINGSFNPGPNGTIVFVVPLARIGNPPADAVLTNVVAGTYFSSDASRSPIVDRGPDAGAGADYTIGEVCVPRAP